MKFAVKLVIALVALTSVGRKAQAYSEAVFKSDPLASSAAVSGSRAASPANQWITQDLDHFNDSDTRTWQMRYFSSGEHFVSGSPMFIYLGGNWAISSDFLKRGGHFLAMAKEHKGYLFYTEHRYYGKSRPTSDLSTANLQYLSVNQTLADLAHFIRTKKAEIPELATSKVIISGPFYGGSLAVWFKRRYPDLVDGVWASSAPILAKHDLFESNEVVGRAYRVLGSEDCYNSIQKGIAELETMFDNNRSAEAKQLLMMHNDFDESNELNQWSLFALIPPIFSERLEKLNKEDMKRFCQSLVDVNNNLTAVTDVIRSWFQESSDPSIRFDFSYQHDIDTYLNVTRYDGGTSRQWYYQKCNELGWFETSGSRNQPFGNKHPLALFTKTCADLFGKQYTRSYIQQNIDQFNEIYGGLNPNVKNVYRSLGEFNPMRNVQHQDDDGAVVIPGVGIYADINGISKSDSSEVRASKERIAELVRKWVAAAPEVAAKEARKFPKQFVGAN